MKTSFALYDDGLRVEIPEGLNAPSFNPITGSSFLRMCECEMSLMEIDIIAFHEKFGLTPEKIPSLLSSEYMSFRFVCLDEELSETKAAYSEASIEDVVDGLVDLIYFAVGTLHLMGVPFTKCWSEVQRANITKKRALPTGSNSKRKSQWDVVKPPGWKGPDHLPILREHGWVGTSNLANGYTPSDRSFMSDILVFGNDEKVDVRCAPQFVDLALHILEIQRSVLAARGVEVRVISCKDITSLLGTQLQTRIV